MSGTITIGLGYAMGYVMGSDWVVVDDKGVFS